jgi:hypothetical protein
VDQVLKLKRFLARPAPAQPRPEDRCGLCAAPIAPEHAHLADLDQRGLLCVCRACFLLFQHPGAGGGKLRAVPERYARADGVLLTSAQWEDFQIPVGMAFFFRNSLQDRVLAFYPSPAGATESTLLASTWEAFVARHPALGTLLPDVEALLVRKRGDGFDCFIVPIAACYELVGRIRCHWKGFHGGEAAWQSIEAFFAALEARCGAAA